MPVYKYDKISIAIEYPLYKNMTETVTVTNKKICYSPCQSNY